MMIEMLSDTNLIAKLHMWTSMIDDVAVVNISENVFSL